MSIFDRINPTDGSTATAEKPKGNFFERLNPPKQNIFERLNPSTPRLSKSQLGGISLPSGSAIPDISEEQFRGLVDDSARVVPKGIREAGAEPWSDRKQDMYFMGNLKYWTDEEKIYRKKRRIANKLQIQLDRRKEKRAKHELAIRIQAQTQEQFQAEMDFYDRGTYELEQELGKAKHSEYGAMAILGDEKAARVQKDDILPGSIGKTLRGGALRAADSVARAGAGVMDIYTEVLRGDTKFLHEGMVDPSVEFIKEKSAGLKQELARWREKYPEMEVPEGAGTGFFLRHPQYLLAGLIENSPLVLSTMAGAGPAASALGKFVGGTLGAAALITPQRYEEAREQGTDPRIAIIYSVLSGLGEGAIESISWGQKMAILGRLKGGVGAMMLQKLLLETEGAYLRGGAEEFTQAVWDNFWKYVFIDREHPLFKDALKQMEMGALQEAGMGLMFGGAGAATSYKRFSDAGKATEKEMLKRLGEVRELLIEIDEAEPYLDKVEEEIVETGAAKEAEAVEVKMLAMEAGSQRLQEELGIGADEAAEILRADEKKEPSLIRAAMRRKGNKGKALDNAADYGKKVVRAVKNRLIPLYEEKFSQERGKESEGRRLADLEEDILGGRASAVGPLGVQRGTDRTAKPRHGQSMGDKYADRTGRRPSEGDVFLQGERVYRYDGKEWQRTDIRRQKLPETVTVYKGEVIDGLPEYRNEALYVENGQQQVFKGSEYDEAREMVEDARALGLPLELRKRGTEIVVVSPTGQNLGSMYGVVTREKGHVLRKEGGATSLFKEDTQVTAGKFTVEEKEQPKKLGPTKETFQERKKNAERREVPAADLKDGDRFLHEGGEVYWVIPTPPGKDSSKVYIKDGKQRVVEATDKLHIIGEVNDPILTTLAGGKKFDDEWVEGFGDMEKKKEEDVLSQSPQSRKEGQERVGELLREKGFKEAAFDEDKKKIVEEIGEDEVKTFVKLVKESPKKALAYLRSSQDVFLKIFEPSKIVERKHGSAVYAEVMKAIHRPEAHTTRWDMRTVEGSARTALIYGQLAEEFDKKYTQEEMMWMMASRGSPVTPAGIEQKADALVFIERSKKRDMMKADMKLLQPMYDMNYRALARLIPENASYFEEYFYGNWKQPTKARDVIKRSLPITNRFLKEKKLAVADALPLGLELRNWNPVKNARSEYSGIIHLAAMKMLRKYITTVGAGTIVVDEMKAQETEEGKPKPRGKRPPLATAGVTANNEQIAKWIDIKSSWVFDGLLFEPDFARLLNNLLATNKVSQSPGLSKLRNSAALLRNAKFVGSAFHHLVELKQDIVDTGPLGFLNPRRTGSAIARAVGKGSLRKWDARFKSKEYIEYLKLGGGHRYSIEVEALNVFVKRMKKWFLPAKYVNWLFDSYIPNVKYTKYQAKVQEVAKKDGKVSDAQKIEVIKEGQNFYGEMNERLFGRSSTATSILRFFFLAPGFREGNYRTMWKSIAQWKTGGPRGGAWRSKLNIPQSLIFTSMVGVLASRIFTGKWREPPESLDEMRDLFKIDTGLEDEKGRKILIDVLTYDKDYWEQIVVPGWTAASGKPLEASKNAVSTFIKTTGGMKSPLFDVVLDLGVASTGDVLTDWVGDRVFFNTDTAPVKMTKMAKHWAEKVEPISFSVFRRMRRKGYDFKTSLIASALGLRPSMTEHDKKVGRLARDIYELRTKQEELYYSLEGAANPKEMIRRHNADVDRVLKNELYKDLPEITLKRLEKFDVRVDEDKLVENKVYSYFSPSTEPEKKERIKGFLGRMGIDEADYVKELNDRRKRLKAGSVTDWALAGGLMAGDSYAPAAKVEAFYLERLELDRKYRSKEITARERRKRTNYYRTAGRLRKYWKMLERAKTEKQKKMLYRRIETVIDAVR